MTARSEVDGLLRELAPQAVGIVARTSGQFDAAEDAVQEAMIAASTAWTTNGLPQHALSWLVAVARRRLIDEWRSDSARRAREENAAVLERPVEAEYRDDSLTVLFLCCHPSLSVASQLALTLRAVGGLTTTEIARAFLVPEATIAQRISRAKQQIRAAGSRFELPPDSERGERLAVVRHVLYLIFNEGYTPGARESVSDADLATEAIRLTRMLHLLLPDDTEVAGLLALMLLTDARRDARTTENGALVPLDEQDRARWNREQIEEGSALAEAAITRGLVGPYQLQAAIAAVHDEAGSDDATDWPQILALYSVLENIAPNPIVTLNRAVAVSRVHGTAPALELLATLDGDDRMRRSHRLHAVRGRLLEQSGDIEAARVSYEQAVIGTPSVAERNHLLLKVATLRELASES